MHLYLMTQDNFIFMKCGEFIMKKNIAAIFLIIQSVLISGCSDNDVNLETEKVAYLYGENAIKSTQVQENESYTESTSQEIIKDVDNVNKKTQKSENNTYKKPEEKNNKINNIINISPLNQLPELPTGCETTSLTMVLQYYGFDADKCDLADNFLDKGPVGKTDFRVAFEGDPRDSNSYGCYAPVVKNMANKYLKYKNSDYTATDITGTSLKNLFQYIDKKIPVIVWGTLDCREGRYTATWNVNGKELRWFYPEHCMVLVGYDNEKSLVWVNDPIHGDVRSYDMNIFESRYNSLFKQAVIIQ